MREEDGTLKLCVVAPALSDTSEDSDGSMNGVRSSLAENEEGEKDNCQDE
jgi:hypothetical protein